uniref:ATP synthase F0 subunit 6 n=1 Tax=Cellana orientalis TaxID=351212 RepID=UPI0020294F50|nr:ATP synthase F0 subunit 6 [Cellana orientalis]UPX89388.1 ATP synthase F0 subunit 6 [Cellana orientalis]
MLVDIFSTFDDNNFVFMSYYLVMWVFSLACVFLFFCSNKWVGYSSFNELINLFKQISFSQSTRSFGSKMGGFSLVLSSFFVMLINMNLAGLMPYVFSVTAHLSLSLSFGICFWLSLIISGFAYKPLVAASGLLPVGAPSFLNPFLVLVESVSICFRPLTISVRLVANISAGHIILGLIGMYMSQGIFCYSFLALGIIIFVEIGYFVFEFGVSVIQGYIFFLLITLYSDEHPH